MIKNKLHYTGDYKKEGKMDKLKNFKVSLALILAGFLVACDKTEEKTEKLSISAVTNETLLNSATKTDGWYMYGGSYENWRHSSLKQINRRNVDSLVPKWIFQPGIKGQLSGSPLVIDGIMYLSAAYNNLWALNAETGEPIWHYERDLPTDLRICCGPANRGVSVAGGKLFMATLDAYLIAMDRETGEVLWEVQLEDHQKGYSGTSAPLIVDDLVITGIAGGEFGARGFIDAYEASTGKRVWRTYSVPSAGEKGVETWAGESWKTGGSPTWAVGTYDKQTHTLYWPTGNPSPDWNGDARKGDNLYSNSLLALDPETGEMKWYFQFTPHDVWDFDATNPVVLTDMKIDGVKKRVLVQPNRNGYVYVIDASDGSFLKGFQYVDQLNWSKGLDENGRPIVDYDFVPTSESKTARNSCPGAIGGHNGAWSWAFNPNQKIMYVASIEACNRMVKQVDTYKAGDPFWGGGPVETDKDTGKNYGNFLAIDPVSQSIKWKYKDKYPMVSGALSTDGDVVFTANQEGYAMGFDALNGDLLWKFQMGTSARGQPITWEQSGKQYVAITSGGGGLAVEIVGEPPMVTRGNALMVFGLPK